MLEVAHDLNFFQDVRTLKKGMKEERRERGVSFEVQKAGECASRVSGTSTEGQISCKI